MLQSKLFSFIKKSLLAVIVMVSMPLVAYAEDVAEATDTVAEEGGIIAKPWQLGFSEASSPVMERINSFHNELLFIITGIVLFVLGLLLFVLIRFNKKANPVPSKTTHNVALEVAWTIIPVVILAIVVIPSMRLLYFQDKIEKADMTLKVTGYQWYWGYEYPDHGDIAFDAIMIPDAEIKEGQKRLLETYNKVVLPVDTNIRVLVAAADVIHAWAVPSLGVKKDAVPGQLNETWLRINKPGIYYGQCSELCGEGHGFMPIQIEAVTPEEFEAWVKKAKLEFGEANDNEEREIQLAQAGGQE